MTEKPNYAIPLADLERSAHVAPKDMVTEQGEPPHPDALAPEDLDRQRLLGISGAGRLRTG